MALLAVVALGAGTPSAFAGAGEVKALQTALGAVPIASATSQQLLDAFRQVLATNPKLNTDKKQGVVAGEALKAAGLNAQDAGEVFGNAIVAAVGNGADPLSTIPADRRNFVALAAKTAGTGKGLNVLQIPGLSSTLFAFAPGDAGSSVFITSAQASKNKPGSGAILGGRARQFVDNDVASAPVNSAILANSALFDKTLQKSAQDIARYIAAELAATSDTAGLAVAMGVGNADANNKFAVQIAVGTSAGDPTNAGNIAHAIFGQQILNDDGTQGAAPLPTSAGLKAAAIKGLTKIAKDMSAVADIEEIQKIGNAIGQEIQSGAIKFAKAASTVKTLATAVMNKPKTDLFGGLLGQNTDANKQDEIAEVAAYMIGGLIGSAELNALVGTKAKSAATKLLAIVNAAAKVKPKKTKGVVNGPAAGSFAADVVGSVALTIQNAPIGTGAGEIPLDIKQAFQALLQDPKTAAKIDKANAATIAATIAGVYGNDPVVIAKLESGLDLMGAVSDPETDFRPFNTPGGQS